MKTTETTCVSDELCCFKEEEEEEEDEEEGTPGTYAGLLKRATMTFPVLYSVHAQCCQIYKFIKNLRHWNILPIHL